MGAFVFSAAEEVHAQEAIAKAAAEQSLEEITNRNYDDAITLLDAVVLNCKKHKCTAATEAEVHLNLGIAHGLKEQPDKARANFEIALAKKPDAEPNARFMTRKLKQIWTEAQEKAKAAEAAKPVAVVPVPKPAEPKPAAPPPKPAESKPAESKPAAPPPKPAASKPAATKGGAQEDKGSGGKALTAEQADAIASAKKLLDSNDWEGCLASMVQSLASGDYASGKLMAARCQDKGDLLVEAKGDAETAARLAKADKDDALAKAAQSFVQELDESIPRINLKYQAGVTDLTVKIDGAKVAPDKIREPLAHNPGTALIEVTGKRGGEPYEFSKKVTFQRSESIDLDVVSTETPLQACYRKARNAAEKKACDDKYNPGAKGLNFKTGVEVSSYNDTNQVDVVSPAIFFAAVQPTQGWNIGGQAIVDLVSTASADIVAMASRRFDQARVGGSVGGGYKVGVATIGVNGATSIENDYVARSAGVNLSADLFDKMVSPYLTYDFGFDILGRARTEFAVFSRELYRHTVNFGASVIFNPSTVGIIGGTFEADLGDSSKPYRHVPMFDASVAPEIPQAASAALVAAGRLPMMPFEQLPTSRKRYAALLGFLHRFDTSTIRATERLYMDDWGQLASTTDVRFLWDFYEAKGAGGAPGYPQLRLTPHGRFNVQGPVSFWQRAYVASQSVGGYEIPMYRTGDRELGPLWAVTGGVGLRSSFNRVVSLSVQAEGVYTRFLDHLYLFDRWGLFTASTLELEFD
ncbi:MAG: DUF3570 domain-containing protein [Deltaproteobacteria bacterium]|nr:DUF3570 domain-containing protein [Deltaproteobacteria bacterium]